MKVFISHSSNYDFVNKLYKPLRNSKLNKVHKIFLPYEDSGKGKIVLTKNIIKNSDVVIAEVSYPSTGQGIELAWVNAFEVPIICIYKQNCKVSKSLKYLTKTLIAYKDTRDMISKLKIAIDKLSSPS